MLGLVARSVSYLLLAPAQPLRLLPGRHFPAFRVVTQAVTPRSWSLGLTFGIRFARIRLLSRLFPPAVGTEYEK